MAPQHYKTLTNIIMPLTKFFMAIVCLFRSKNDKWVIRPSSYVSLFTSISRKVTILNYIQTSSLQSGWLAIIPCSTLLQYRRLTTRTAASEVTWLVLVTLW